MSHEWMLDRGTTALVLLDFTTGVVERYGRRDGSEVAAASRALASARTGGIGTRHVVTGVADPHGHVLLAAGGIHPALAPAGDEAVHYKRKMGAFSTTALGADLRASGIRTLVLAGIATSGTVLSTTRWAYDEGYEVVVIADACSDPDPKVHDLLTGERDNPSYIGLWRLATVVDSAAFSRRAGN